MRILISAYSCETGRGSEGEIGWRMVYTLAERHEVRVITRANLRSVHEASFAKVPKPAGLTFEYFDLPWIFRFYKTGKRFYLVYYYLWQIGVGLRARRMLRHGGADIVHHLIGGMDWMPAGLAMCPGPFVWGPVGSEDTHPVILQHLSLNSRLKDKARIVVRSILRNVEPFNRFTGVRADIVLSHTPETLPRRYANKIHPFNQTGIADLPELARKKTEFSRSERLKLVFAGELKDWKGAGMALDAALLAFERGVKGDLTVIGDGPLRTEMEAAVAAHPNGKHVRFLGRVPMAQLVEELNSGDIFLYPSFHHGLATIVLQAMLTGLPIICIEGDATGRAVGQDAGITVRLSSDMPPVEGLARAIAELDDGEERRQCLATSAQKLALDFYSYEALARRVEDIYSHLIKGTS